MKLLWLFAMVFGGLAGLMAQTENAGPSQW